MAGRVMHPRGISAEGPGAWTVVEEIDRRLGSDLESERLALLHDSLVEKVVVAVQHDGRAEHLLRAPDTGDVVQVGVRQQNVANREAVLLDGLEEQLDVVSRVDDDAFPRLLAAKHKTVLHERRGRPCLQDHVSL